MKNKAIGSLALSIFACLALNQCNGHSTSAVVFPPGSPIVIHGGSIVAEVGVNGGTKDYWHEISPNVYYTSIGETYKKEAWIEGEGNLMQSVPLTEPWEFDFSDRDKNGHAVSASRRGISLCSDLAGTSSAPTCTPSSGASKLDGNVYVILLDTNTGDQDSLSPSAIDEDSLADRKTHRLTFEDGRSGTSLLFNYISNVTFTSAPVAALSCSSGTCTVPCKNGVCSVYLTKQSQ